jgi:ADP-dependent NAD(P)H-hydrate dehydratase / NAD(P)H-hydrate epimerase
MLTLPLQLYTAAQVREMDRCAIEDYGIPGLQLMHRAGQAVFEEICVRWPDIKKLIIYCGVGNNAGDGYVIARLAREKQYEVKLISLVDCERLTGDAGKACAEFLSSGGSIHSFDGEVSVENGVIVDALFGTGLDRDITGHYATAIKLINESTCPVIAVDIPSGLHADSGRVMGAAVEADCTVSFIGLKQGLFTGEAREYCGEIAFSSLAVPDAVFTGLTPAARLIKPHKIATRRRCAHKGHHGHVLLIGGDYGYTGAIRLAAEAALRSGAGLVSVATREGQASIVNCNRPEIMCHEVGTLGKLESLLEKANVVVIGPGLGQSAWAKMLYSKVMDSSLACVVDADALIILATQPTWRENRVITPHPGEAGRLLNCSTQDIAMQRFKAVQQLQSKYGGIALLKGAGTLVKSETDLFVSTSGNPGMASGGMGDVLSGVIGALIGQGWSALEATTTAVHIHGAAADVAAKNDGERGLLASDLLPIIRKLLN